MLLVKLQQKDLLSDHLGKMLAKFQDDPGMWGWLLFTTLRCPRPESRN